MKYEKPEVTALLPAIKAIQGRTGDKVPPADHDNPVDKPEGIGAYQDWE
jgi:hypothetical protein